MTSNSPSSSNLSSQLDSSTLSYDVDAAMRDLGRGRGRGRGQGRGRGRGRGATSLSRGGTARGRGGRRGKKKETGLVHLTQGDVDHLQELHERRIEEGEALIDDLSLEGAKILLKQVLNKQPLLVLDLAQAVQDEAPGPEDPLPNSSQRPEWPSWCVCHKCREMRSPLSNVCCQMRPDLCHSTMDLMRLVITDPGVLRVQQLYRGDVFAQHATTEEDVNKSLRYAAYRQYILTQYGRLGHMERRPVPSCCTLFIRDKFPDPYGVYVDYVPSW